MKKELEMNRVHWDESTRVHLRGDLYGVETFKAGGCRLHRVDVEEVGDVKGKRLLHLQCHFGLDTLSWARRGAIVTGVDFSTESIAGARRLAAETGIQAEFVCSDLYELPEPSFHSTASTSSTRRTASSAGCRTWRPGPRSSPAT